jgi:hypothetical protein
MVGGVDEEEERAAGEGIFFAGDLLGVGELAGGGDERGFGEEFGSPGVGEGFEG